MKLHVPITAAILVPLLALGPSCAVTISASSAVVALTPGAAWATTNAMVGGPGGGAAAPPRSRVWFKNHKRS